LPYGLAYPTREIGPGMMRDLAEVDPLVISEPVPAFEFDQRVNW
jgi:hypothetical protein